MRDIPYGDQQILLMVIWLVLTRVETEEKLLKTEFLCFPDRLQENGGGWGTVGIAGTFLWNSVRRCKCQKVG